MTPELDAAMKESSLSHLTAVSGANCAIVVGLAFGAVAAAGGSRRARVGGGVAALIGFVLLVTPEPSVVRAAAMALIAMLGVLLGRTGAGIAVLCLAVTVLLVGDPWLSGSLGFALSAVATGSLLLWARPLATGLAQRMPRAMALALSVPLAAQLACGPLLVIITPTVPLYGVIANLLAAPAAPIATIVGLAACLSAPLPWVQSGLTAIAWLPAAWIAGTAHTVSSLPGDQVPWLEGWTGVAALAAVSLAIGAVIVVPRVAAAGRISKPQGIRAVAVLLLASSRAPSPEAPRSPRRGPVHPPHGLEHSRVRRRPGGRRAAALGGGDRAHRRRTRSGTAQEVPVARGRRPHRPPRAHPLRPRSRGRRGRGRRAGGHRPARTAGHSCGSSRG